MAKNLTEVRLINVPFENDYAHTLYFESESDQFNYFAGKARFSEANITYIRKDKIIRYPADYVQIRDMNYVMYRNEPGGKWHYAFIQKKEFISEGRTDIYIEDDVIQTWLKKYVMHPCFVEREHVKDDTIGLHTYPESVETGPYIVNKRNACESLLDTCLIMAVTVNLNKEEWDWFDTKQAPASGGVYNGIFSGVKYYKVSAAEAKTIIEKLAETGQSEAIVSIFTAPSALIETESTGTYKEVATGKSSEKGGWNFSNIEGEELIKKPTKINGHTVKNNKLFTYPYCYLLMSNNSGAASIYKYEEFAEDNCEFRIYGAITPGMSIRMIPLNYNGCERNNEEGMNLGKFPICSWASDTFTNWMTQNSINNGVSIAGGLAVAAVGVASALAAVPTGGASVGAGATTIAGMTAAEWGAAGAVVGGVNSVMGTVGQITQHSYQPPQASGNTNCGDVTFSAGYLTFTAHDMSIKKEYAEIIDEFFSMYGYKVNRVKTPESNHRAEWWYTKTIDANIDGPIPPEDLMKIKACYNKGITFWKNPANIKNYAKDNSII